MFGVWLNASCTEKLLQPSTEQLWRILSWTDSHGDMQFFPHEGAENMLGQDMGR
jgi:hypothetical protein